MAIPRTDDGLRAFSENLIEKCDANKTAWGLPADEITALRALHTDYVAKLAVSQSPDRTKAATVAKNESKAALKAGLEVFIGKRLEYNTAITNPIREELGLGLKDTVRTKVLRPDKPPVFYIEIRGARILVIHFKAEGAESNARPYGYNGAVIRWLVLDASAPAPVSEDDLTKSVLATDTPHVFEFPAEDREKKVYFAIAWQTNSGLLGPFSEILVENVP